MYKMLIDFIKTNDLKTSEILIKELINNLIDKKTLKFYIIDLYQDKEIIKENLYIFNNFELIQLIKALETRKYLIINYEMKKMYSYNTLNSIISTLKALEILENLEKEDIKQIKELIKQLE